MTISKPKAWAAGKNGTKCSVSPRVSSLGPRVRETSPYPETFCVDLDIGIGTLSIRWVSLLLAGQVAVLKGLRQFCCGFFGSFAGDFQTARRSTTLDPSLEKSLNVCCTVYCCRNQKLLM